jgi:hypothetical protein
VLVVALCALAAGASSASANPANCYKVVTAGTGTFSNAECTTTSGSKEYVEVIEIGMKIGTNEYCAKVKEGTGVYEDNKCTKAGGKKEYIKISIPAPAFIPKGGKFPVFFTDTSGTTELRPKGHKPIICKKDKSVGEITGSKTVANGVVTYEECKQGEANCNSVVVAEEGTTGGTGVIITNKLSGELKSEPAATSGVVETLFPTSPEKRFVSIKCATVNVAVKGKEEKSGEVSGEVTPVGKMQTTGELNFKEGTNGGCVFESAAEKHCTSLFVPTEGLQAFSETAAIVGKDTVSFFKNAGHTETEEVEVT